MLWFLTYAITSLPHWLLVHLADFIERWDLRNTDKEFSLGLDRIYRSELWGNFISKSKGCNCTIYQKMTREMWRLQETTHIMYSSHNKLLINIINIHIFSFLSLRVVSISLPIIQSFTHYKINGLHSIFPSSSSSVR